MDDEFRAAYRGSEFFAKVIFSADDQTEESLEEIQIWSSDGEVVSFHPHQPHTDLQHRMLELVYERYGFSLVLENV